MANVKISTINTTAGYQQPVNPNTTGVLANGFYPQNATSNDGNAGVERDANNYLALRAGSDTRAVITDLGTLTVDNPGTGATPSLEAFGYGGGSVNTVGVYGDTSFAGALLVTNTNATGGGISVEAAGSKPAVQITQTGTGLALRVEDSTSPDATPFVVDASGSVGIGTTTPTNKLFITGETASAPASIKIDATAHATSRRAGILLGDWLVAQDSGANGAKDFFLRDGVNGYNPFFVGTNGTVSTHTSSDFTFTTRYSNDALGPALISRKSRATSIYTNTIVQDGDVLMALAARGATGTADTYDNAALIQVKVDGTPGASNDMPGRIEFYTTANGTATLTERMRISNQGNVTINSTTSGTALTVNKGGILLTGETAATATALFIAATTDATSERAGAQFGDWVFGQDGNADGTKDFFFYNTAQRMKIGTTGTVTINAPSSGNALTAAGQIECTATGYKFPDATTQTTSAGSIARLTSAATTTSTNFADITGLTFAVAAATAYFFEAYIIWQQNNTSGGIGFAVNGPASPTILDYTIEYQNFANDAAGTMQTVHATAYDSAYTIPTSTTAANTNYIARISGVLVTAAAGGTLALRFKTNNASYTASARAGSWLMVRRGNT